MIQTQNTCRGRLFKPTKPGGYTWTDSGGDWRIRQGLSGFLIAKGSGYSRATGRELYAQLIRLARNTRGKTRAR